MERKFFALEACVISMYLDLCVIVSNTWFGV